MELEGTGDGYWFFLRADGAFSLPAFDRRVPLRFARGVVCGVGFPGAGLSQTQPVGKSSESRFKAGSTGGVSLWCCGCHEGVCGHAGGFLRHSRGARGGRSSPAVLGGVVDGAITPRRGTKRPGRKKSYRVELLPGARFGISVESSAVAWWGQRLGGERSPGSLTIRGVHSFSGSWTLGFQPRNFSPGRAGALSISSLSNTRGIIEKKISIFSKQATWLLV